MNWILTRGRAERVALLSLLAVAACGQNSTGGPNGSALSVTKGNPSGDAQTATVGQDLPTPFLILVKRDGVPEAGATVTWQTAAPGAVLNPTTGTTDVTGSATTQLTLGTTAGSQTVQATVVGGRSLIFSATALAAAPARIRLLTSGAVTGPVNSVLGQPIQVKVEDRFGNGVGGVSVTWQVASGTAQLSPATSVSNAQGVASTTLTFGNAPGNIQIQATAAGLTGSPVVLGATATATANIVTVQLLTTGGNRFNPTRVVISAGTTVRFDWVGGFHDVTSAGTPGFASSGAPTFGPKTYDVRFSTPGTYGYFCTVHGTATSGMHGSIVVQ
jgi:plastocyanin